VLANAECSWKGGRGRPTHLERHLPRQQAEGVLHTAESHSGVEAEDQYWCKRVRVRDGMVELGQDAGSGAGKATSEAG